MVTNTTFYLHSMGTKNSGVNNESKQYLTRKATVLSSWTTGRTLPHTLLCTVTQHQKQHFQRYTQAGHSFQPYMEMQSTVWSTREHQPQFRTDYMEVTPCSVVKACVLKSHMYIHTILIIFKTGQSSFKLCCINKNEIEKEPNDHLKFKIPKSSNLYTCERLHQGFWEVQDCSSQTEGTHPASLPRPWVSPMGWKACNLCRVSYW